MYANLRQSVLLWQKPVHTQGRITLQPCWRREEAASSDVRLVKPAPRWWFYRVSLQVLILPDFLDSLKTTADIEATLSVPYPASIWRLTIKFVDLFFFRKLCFTDVMSRHFTHEAANAAKMHTSFKANANENAERYKIRRPTKWLPQIVIFFNSDP